MDKTKNFVLKKDLKKETNLEHLALVIMSLVFLTPTRFVFLVDRFVQVSAEDHPPRPYGVYH